MPHFFNTHQHIDHNYDHSDRIDDRILREIPQGNKIFNFSSRPMPNCPNCLPRSKLSTLPNQSTHPKPQIRFLSAKIAQKKHFSKGKLFQKAKLISDSNRETFLAPRSAQTERAVSYQTKLKTIRYLRVTPQIKKNGNKQPSPKKTRSVGDEKAENKVLEEYYIQPQNENSVQNNKTIVSKNVKERFTLDYQQGQMLKNKNMFSSSSGQMLLENLIGTGTMKSKSNPGIKTIEKETILNNSRNNEYFLTAKPANNDTNQKSQTSKIRAKNSIETSFFKQISTEKKPIEGVVSSFSRLIMRDRIRALRSDELDLSKTIDEESFEQLSVMSKR